MKARSKAMVPEGGKSVTISDRARARLVFRAEPNTVQIQARPLRGRNQHSLSSEPLEIVVKDAASSRALARLQAPITN